MKVLGIETATIVCAAALVEDGVVRAERSIEKKNAHAESIMTLIDGVLRVASIHLEDIDVIAVSIGPGSFTGLRIGLSVAKGLCYAADKPLVAVPTLRALSLRALQAPDDVAPFLLAALDARRDEVYCQLYRVDGGAPEQVWEQQDLSLDELAVRLEGLSVSLTGDAREKVAAHGRISSFSLVNSEFASCNAGTVALEGERMARRGAFTDPMVAEPAYLKAFHTFAL